MDLVYERFCLDVPNTARFLVPQPQTSDGALAFTFAIGNLESDVNYTALSYVWGASTESCPEHILLEGVRFPVTPNLLSALTMVQGAAAQNTNNNAGLQLLWADQLCINQKDNAEKTSQVAQMGGLYATAQKVFICLGSSETAQDAVRLVTQVSQRISNEKARYGSIKSIPVAGVSELDWQWYKRFNWDALRTLLRQPWFGRVWVVQEAGLARHAVALYGGHSFEWGSLMLILSWLSESGNRLRRKYTIPGWATPIMGVIQPRCAR